MMVKDHTAASNELKQVASELNVQLPTQLDQKHRDLVERLSKLQGAAFDRSYMDAMAQGHEDVVGKLAARTGNPAASKPTTADRSDATVPTGTADRGSSAAGNLKPVEPQNGARGEQALTQWAMKTLPTVQQHLQRARELQQKVAK